MIRSTRNILPFLLVALLWGCIDAGKERPVAVNGVMDLKAWDFKKDGPVRLEKNWEFYRMLKLSPGDFDKPGVTEGRGLIRLAGIGLFNPWWKLYVPEYYLGYATYRMKIVSRIGDADPGLLLHTVRTSAYKFYLNGALIHQNGRPVPGGESIESGYSASVIPLRARDGVNEIVIQAGNYRFPAGSVEFNIDIGPRALLQGYMLRDNLLAIFFVIVILVLCLNQLVIFCMQRSELQYLYFGLCCFGVLCHTVGLHNIYFSTMLPAFPWDGAAMIMMGMLYAGDWFFWAFLQRIFPLDVPKRLLYVMGAANGTLGLAMAVLPEKGFAYLLPVYHVHAVVSVLVLIVVVFRTVLLRREDAMFLMMGLLAGTGVNLILVVLNICNVITGDLETMLLGTLFFCIIQTIGTMRNFIRSHRRSISLAADNKKMAAVLGKRLGAGSNVITDTVEAKIVAAIDYLRGNYTEDISRENLAAALGLHPGSLSRYFKLHTGKKYVDYLNGLRIAEAIRLLRETDTPIITIAMNAGFRSLRTFNHAFINATGRTPSDYRGND